MKLVHVTLHPATVAMLAAIAHTELDSANNSAAFFGRTNRPESAEKARERAAAWAITASNLSIAARKVEE